MASIFTVNYNSIQNALSNRRAANEAARFSQSISRASEKLKTSGDAIALRHNQAYERMMQDYENNNTTRELNYRHAEESRNLNYDHNQQMRDLNLKHAKQNIQAQELQNWVNIGFQTVQLGLQAASLYANYKESQVQKESKIDMQLAVPFINNAIATGAAYYDTADGGLVWEDGGAALNNFLASSKSRAMETIGGGARWVEKQYDKSQELLRATIESSVSSGLASKWAAEYADNIKTNQQAALNMDIANGTLSAVPEMLKQQYGVDSVDQLPPEGQAALRNLSIMFYGTAAANDQHGPVLTALAGGASPESVIEQAKKNMAEIIGVGSEEGYGSAADKQRQVDLANKQIESFVNVEVPAMQKANEKSWVTTQRAYYEGAYADVLQRIANGETVDTAPLLNNLAYLRDGTGTPTEAVRGMKTLPQFAAGAQMSTDDLKRYYDELTKISEAVTTGKVVKLLSGSDKGPDKGDYELKDEWVKEGVAYITDQWAKGNFSGSLYESLTGAGVNEIFIRALNANAIRIPEDYGGTKEDFIAEVIATKGTVIAKAIAEAPVSQALRDANPELNNAINRALRHLETATGNMKDNPNKAAIQADYIKMIASVTETARGDVTQAIRELDNAINAETVKNLKIISEIKENENSPRKMVSNYYAITSDMISGVDQNGNQVIFSLDSTGKFQINQGIANYYASAQAKLKSIYGANESYSKFQDKALQQPGGDIDISTILIRDRDGVQVVWRPDEKGTTLELWQRPAGSTGNGGWEKATILQQSGLLGLGKPEIADVTWRTIPATTRPTVPGNPFGETGNREGNRQPRTSWGQNESGIR
jgi:hypothetical protein